MKRKKQTGRQRLMRKFALMVYLDRPYGESLRRVAREVWAVYPKGYKTFEAFYESLRHLALNYTNGR